LPPTAAAPATARSASKARSRRQLIASTIDSIARRGFAETTLARVAEGAGLSRGIVNFHFRTKEALLVETLRQLAEEYRRHWWRALARAGDDPAAGLEALLLAGLDPRVCSRKKLAVWFAFLGEARSRPTYLALCGAMDVEHATACERLCARLIEAGGYRGLEPAAVARGLGAMIDGLWLDLLIAPRRFNRALARETLLAYLARLFPRHYPSEVAARRR